MAVDIFELLLNEEFSDFVKGNKEEKSKIDFINNKGDSLFTFIDNEDSLKGIFQRLFEITFKPHDEVFKRHERLFEDIISDDILETENINFEEGLMLLEEMISEKDFAGCLFINGETVLNISHPFILFQILKEKEKWFNKEGKFVFYSFSENALENASFKKFEQETYKEATLALKLINDFATEELESKRTVVNESRNFSDIYNVSSINSYIEVNIKVEADYAIIPLQIASRGELVPYFGMALLDLKPIRDGYAPSGWSHWTNFTGNLSNDNNVCSGDKSNKTLEGWYTLSKININSMYFQTIINPAYVNIAKGYLKITKDILKGNTNFELQDEDLDWIEETNFTENRKKKAEYLIKKIESEISDPMNLVSSIEVIDLSNQDNEEVEEVEEIEE
jgi:hypothetical protein